MNKVDFLYKVITRLINDGDSFIHINYLGNNNYEFLPINFVNVEMLEYLGELYLQFYFHRGETVILPYSEIIHLRRHFSDSDMFGSKPSMDAVLTCQVTHDTGLVNNITNSNSLRGILEHSGMLKDADLKAQKEKFVTDYLSISNYGGIAAIDNKYKFTPVAANPQITDDKLSNYLSNRIYKSFNLNENIVSNSYDENTWNAFYESCIEPIAEQLSLEFTNKIFTEREKGFKNEITFTANKMEFTSLSTKITMAEKLMMLFTINEMREIFNREPVEGGDVRLQSLNFVDSSKANEYQMNKKEEVKEEIKDEVINDEDNKDSGTGDQSTPNE
jgi:phage portal protein BeeE